MKKVEEQTLPELDAEFCRAFGVEEGGLEALRKEVRTSMERELDGVIRNRVRAQVLDALYRDNPLEVPRALVDEQVQQLQIETARRMGRATPASCRRARVSSSRPAGASRSA